MLVVLIGWAILTPTIFWIQSAHYGYGSGFGDGRHVPSELVAAAEGEGVPKDITSKVQPGMDVDQIADATNIQHRGGVWHDTWRLALSLAVMLAIVYAWYLIISRVGEL